MPVAIQVRHDFLKLRDPLDDFAKRQMPFAAARALTETARSVQRDMTAQLPSIFDRPTPFTQRAIGIKPARKTDLVAEVFVKDIQARYLKLQQTGGSRSPEPQRPVTIPVDAARNQYGNLPRGALRRLRGRRDVFVGTVRGTTGFWQRIGPGRLRLLAVLERTASYRPRFGYHERVAAVVKRDFGRLLDEHLAKALATARK